jgi:histidinol-phosphate aminotransferase
MTSNRRNWLRQMSLIAGGLGTMPLKNLASPMPQPLEKVLEDAPIRLSSNENPYGPSPLARIAMAENVIISNRYNWTLTSELVAVIAKKNNLTTDTILIGAGSTEILDRVVQLAALEKGNFIVAEPTFSYWGDAAQTLGLKKIAVPLTADKKHNLAAMLKAITAETRLIYICNPNNPTGTICETAELVAFIKEATKSVLVLVDEAYIDFTTQKSVSNLKTLSLQKHFLKFMGLQVHVLVMLWRIQPLLTDWLTYNLGQMAALVSYQRQGHWRHWQMSNS